MTSSKYNAPVNKQMSLFAALRNKINIDSSLARQASITFTLLIAIILILSGTLWAWQFILVLEDEILTRQIAVSARAAVVIESFLDRLSSELDVLTHTGDGELEHAAEYIPAIVSLEPGFLELIIVDLEGNIINKAVDDKDVLGNLFTINQAQWFVEASQGKSYVSRLQISATNKPYVILARPIIVDNNIQGIIASRVDMHLLWDTVADIEIGQTGLVYVVDQAGILIAHPNPDMVLSGINLAEDPDFIPIFNDDQDRGFRINGLNGVPAVGATATIANADWKVVTELPTEEAFAAMRRTLAIFVGFTLLTVVASEGLVTFIMRRFVRPISDLVGVAHKFGQGDLNHRVPVTGGNELATLATAFNSMTSQLRELIGSLEQRVAERTQALEISSEVSRRLSTILDRQELVKTVVEQVQQAFDYYHANIYLFDETGENLIMVGGTGEAGRIMLANKHQIAAGKGLVGRAGQTANTVLVPDVSQEAGWLPNPLLPDTKAEVAVPILSGQQVLGVLDVQHHVAGGLSQTDADLLQSIANQAAVALRNARLYEDAQRQAGRETVINEINQKILSTTTMKEALQVAVRELGRASGSPGTRVQLKSGDQAQNGRNS